MMKRSLHILITSSLLIVSCFATVRVMAQTNTSPYSIVGIGDIEQSYADRSAGMADAGVSLSSGRYMYHANPASYGALDDHYFSLELNTRFKASSYSGTNIGLTNSSSSDMQVGKFAMAIKVKKFWGASLGLLPYSSSNYSFYSSKYIEGTNSQTQAHYNGTGGLYQFYFGNGFKITKNFSVGLQATFLFGSLIQNETLLTNIVTDSIVTTRNMFLYKLIPKAGFQYKAKLSKNVAIAIGASATPASNLHAFYTLNVRQGATILVNNKNIQDTYFKLPVGYTAGASIVFKNQFTIAADYTAQQWSTTNYTGLGYSLTSSNRLSAGFQYSDQKKYHNLTYEDYFLQGGVYYNNTYLIVNGSQLVDQGFTLGVGANAKRSQLGYQLNLQFGTKGAQNNSSIVKEDYTRIGITIYYRDIWFTKYKKYD